MGSFRVSWEFEIGVGFCVISERVILIGLWCCKGIISCKFLVYLCSWWDFEWKYFCFRVGDVDVKGVELWLKFFLWFDFGFDWFWGLDVEMKYLWV